MVTVASKPAGIFNWSPKLKLQSDKSCKSGTIYFIFVTLRGQKGCNNGTIHSLPDNDHFFDVGLMGGCKILSSLGLVPLFYNQWKKGGGVFLANLKFS